MSELQISVNWIFGSVRLEHREVIEGGRLHFESRRIDLDRHGRTRSIGAWERIGGSLGWDDGTPFTAADHRRLDTGGRG